MDSFLIKIIVNILILLITAIITIVVIIKLKINSKGYKLFFIAYIIFWIPIMLTRPYRGSVQDLINIDYRVWVVAIYGAIGIIVRPLADFVALSFHNRKIILYGAAIIVIATFIPIIFYKTTSTNIIQSIGIGVGASVIGTYELMFKEQYGKSRAFLTVSILAVPPLIADFATAPAQSIIQLFVNKKYGVPPEGLNNLEKLNIYTWTWIIGIIIFLIFLIFSIFIKEDRSYVGAPLGNKVIKKGNKNIGMFLVISIIGIIVMFVKFANSGSTGTTQLQNLQEYTKIDIRAAEGYLSTIFSVSQLAGTFLFGYLSYKNFSSKKIFYIGIGIWIIYHLVLSFIANPISYMAIHTLNGFAYGIIYNLLLGFILSLSFKKGFKLTPMGVYQGLLAIGISGSSFFTASIRDMYPIPTPETSIEELLSPTFTINFIIIAVLTLSTILFFYESLLEKRYSLFKKQMDEMDSSSVKRINNEILSKYIKSATISIKK